MEEPARVALTGYVWFYRRHLRENCMRTVYTNDEIPHLWAHQSQVEARNANKSLWFHGEILYSYREPIGRLITRKGKTAVLLRDETFSVTTSRHQSSASQATSHLTTFHVPSLAGRYQDAPDHAVNIGAYRAKILGIAKLAQRATKYRDGYTTSLVGLVTAANDYSKFFGLRVKFSAPKSDAVKKLIADEKQAAKREMERRKAAEEIQRKEQAVNLELWKAGQPMNDRYPHHFHNLPEAYARIMGEELETTKGARVPLDHVKRAMPIVLRLIERGEEYVRNGHTIHIGQYALDHISTDGTVKAGCHTFPKDEILRIAGLISA